MISLKYCLSIDESLIEELLSDINMHWQQQHYNAIISAIKINGTSIIPNIVDCAPFCWVFEHRANKEIMLLSNSTMWLIVWLCYFLVQISFFLSIKAAASHEKHQKDGLSVKLINIRVGRHMPHHAPHADLWTCMPWSIPQDPCGRGYSGHYFWGSQQWSLWSHPQSPMTRKKHDHHWKEKTRKLESQRWSIFCNLRLVLCSTYKLTELLKNCKFWLPAMEFHAKQRRMKSCKTGLANQKTSCRFSGNMAGSTLARSYKTMWRNQNKVG